VRVDGTHVTEPTIGDLLFPRALKFALCDQCFSGKGLDELRKWALDDSAPDGLAEFFFRVDLDALKGRIDRTRAAYLNKRAGANTEVRRVLGKIEAMRQRICALEESEREKHAWVTDRFEASAERFVALVDPKSTTYALDTLRVRLAPWQVDETPTILAVSYFDIVELEGDSWGAEIAAALRINDPGNHCGVFYGPRFAIDYLQRAVGNRCAYTTATTEENGEVAALAGALWGRQESDLRDLFEALDTARVLLSRGAAHELEAAV
jgi:hypothetical protein